MKIYGLEKLSLVDYDGKVSATLFTGNCNFRCGFCHNSALVIDYDKIPPLDEKEIFDYLTKRFGILEGVCITGGEPTLHRDLPEFIQKIKNIGYSVKLDTNGTNPQMIETLAKNGLVDHFAMDIKNDIENYSSIIGFDKFDTKNVEKSIDYFLNGNVSYEFRTTLINEYHKKTNIENIGKLIQGANKYFLQKFKDSESCIKSHLSAVDNLTAIEFLNILKNYIQNTYLRGYDI